MAAKQSTTQASTPMASLDAMVSGAVQAQQRAISVTQDFSESVLGALKEQAASYSALLRSVDTSLRSMEQAIKSQAESTKALSESLEASRQVVTTAMAAQQQGIERVETFVGSMLGVLGGQLKTLRRQVEIGKTMLSDPVGAQSDMFLQATQEWMGAYDQIVTAAMAPFQHNEKAKD